MPANQAAGCTADAPAYRADLPYRFAEMSVDDALGVARHLVVAQPRHAFTL
ncbi:hypothetical protein GCM10022288_06670 [Gryllotalpicola kribbensis]|jgi:hypothetical protein|uniref:Uncharacterized protein n=1 Tax=Gryllotalpicola kribbensis TaxID=993084 RepID=A0ABP8AKC2_9MICO